MPSGGAGAGSASGVGFHRKSPFTKFDNVMLRVRAGDESERAELRIRRRRSRRCMRLGLRLTLARGERRESGLAVSFSFDCGVLFASRFFP